jgi:hypothetical protein
MIKTRSRAVRATFAVLASLICSLFVAEIILRWTSPVYTAGIQQSYQYDPVLGVRLRDSIHLFRVTDHQEEVRSNRFGTANFQDDFSGYQRLLFALGDSYTQGTGLPADLAYPAQLDLGINRDSVGYYRKRAAVVNLGLAAYGGQQSLLVLERYARLLGNPKACLYLGSDNDFDDDLLFLNGDRHRHVVTGNPRYGHLTPILMWLGNTQIALRLKLSIASRHIASVRRNRGIRQLSDTTSDAKRAAVAGYSMSGSRPRSVAELEWHVIKRTIDACHSRGAVTVLSWSKPPGDSPSYGWLEAKARSEGVPFNDWYSRVASVIRAIPELPISNQHAARHYRGWVSQEIAAGFKRELDSAGVLLPLANAKF